MDLPELKVVVAMFPRSQACAICDRPCIHEDSATGVPSPGAYVASTVNDPHELAKPVCDRCVERHYPELVAPRRGGATPLLDALSMMTVTSADVRQWMYRYLQSHTSWFDSPDWKVDGDQHIPKLVGALTPRSARRGPR